MMTTHEALARAWAELKGGTITDERIQAIMAECTADTLRELIRVTLTQLPARSMLS